MSPSRASDFTRCPLQYRFRAIDRLPEPPSPEALRGTLVHAVLERIFDLPAADRGPEAARALVLPVWDELREREPELVAELFADDAALAAWLATTGPLLETYYALEDPTRFEPAERELFVEADLASGLRLRGVVDRLDAAPSGELRVVDYKTGRAPTERYEQRSMFQPRFYALALWRSRGVVPALLQLMYLGDGVVLTYAPDEDDLLATERKVQAIWVAVDEARRTGDWQPNPGRICDWCSFKALCPAWGGTPPPLPEPEPLRA